MESDRFDALTARLAAPRSRRNAGLLGLLALGSLAVAGQPAQAGKKKKKKGKNKKGNTGKPPQGPTTQPPTPNPPGPTCADGIRNGDETDVDCGGSCPRCAAGKACQTRDDCLSAICQGPPGARTCQACTPGDDCTFAAGNLCICDQTASGQVVCDMADGETTEDFCHECPPDTSCVQIQPGIVKCYPRCSV